MVAPRPAPNTTEWDHDDDGIHAIRELIDAYAFFADHREPDEQAALYAEDGRTLVYNDPAASEPAQVLTGHAEHVEGFRVLSQYAATMPFNGQSSIRLDGDSATGETYTLARPLLDSEEGRALLVLFVRYKDSFIKRDGIWRFAEGKHEPDLAVARRA